ncbi:MAG: 2-oxoacid:acceptor oxidoreductase family protein [Synergistales bacterium]|nr:2-oxoacid:acceptor oxidoreductase family protein [Synergistales bacterium]
MRVVIVGLGGQGILFSSRVIGYVARMRDEHVMGSEVHGMAQRGGSVVSHVKIGPYRSPLVRKGEADILLAFEQGEGIRNLDYLKPGGTAVLNIHQPADLDNGNLQNHCSRQRIALRTLQGYDLLREHMGGRFLFLNVLILGAMSALGLGGFSYEEMHSAVGALAPPKHRDDNFKVLQLGYQSLTE